MQDTPIPTVSKVQWGTRQPTGQVSVTLCAGTASLTGSAQESLCWGLEKGPGGLREREEGMPRLMLLKRGGQHWPCSLSLANTGKDSGRERKGDPWGRTACAIQDALFSLGCANLGCWNLQVFQVLAAECSM